MGAHCTLAQLAAGCAAVGTVETGDTPTHIGRRQLATNSLLRIQVHNKIVRPQILDSASLVSVLILKATS